MSRTRNRFCRISRCGALRGYCSAHTRLAPFRERTACTMKSPLPEFVNSCPVDGEISDCCPSGCSAVSDVVGRGEPGRLSDNSGRPTVFSLVKLASCTACPDCGFRIKAAPAAPPPGPCQLLGASAAGVCDLRPAPAPGAELLDGPSNPTRIKCRAARPQRHRHLPRLEPSSRGTVNGMPALPVEDDARAAHGLACLSYRA